jgi:Protein of unknown function (DUF1499)
MRWMLVSLLAVTLVITGGAIALRLYMGRAAEDELRPDERIVISELRAPIPSNAFLACPPGYCAEMAAPSPVFALPVERLSQLWAEMIAREPHVVTVLNETAQHRLVVIQHTPLLRLPDIITVEFVALAADRSSVAVYSQARYGKGDFGTNRKRVLTWLSQVEPWAVR